MVPYKFFFAVLLFLCCSLSSADFFPDYQDDNPLPLNHERIRRFVRFMSRKPGPDAKPEMGIGFKGHLMNLLKGGTLGMEFHIPHVNRLGKHFPYWNEFLGNKRSIGKGKDEEEEKVEEEVKMEDEVKILEGELDAEDEEEGEGQDADEDEDEEENELEKENREENELDYEHLINPRVKDREP